MYRSICIIQYTNISNLQQVLIPYSGFFYFIIIIRNSTIENYVLCKTNHVRRLTDNGISNFCDHGFIIR